MTKCHLHSGVVLSRLNRHDEALRCLGQVGGGLGGRRRGRVGAPSRTAVSQSSSGGCRPLSSRVKLSVRPIMPRLDAHSCSLSSRGHGCGGEPKRQGGGSRHKAVAFLDILLLLFGPKHGSIDPPPSALMPTGGFSAAAFHSSTSSTARPSQ